MRAGKPGRRSLRGKPLLPQCAGARIGENELPGIDACYGLTDCNPGICNDECIECGALVWNSARKEVCG